MTTPDWKSDARRKLNPPSAPRPWTTQIDLPEGTDPLVLAPDALALARDLAPPGWVAVGAEIISGRGCTMAPRWRGWMMRLQYVPERAPARRDWYITETAIACYVRLHAGALAEHTDPPDQAAVELEDLAAHATRRERRGHLELWRSPRNHGSGMRWLLDVRRSSPAVIWVGYGNPPTSLWER